MNLAFSTNAFTRFPLEDALRSIKAAGLEGVEILADAPHAYPGQVDAADVRRELERLGLHVSNVNANCTFGYWKDAPPEPYFEPSIISPEARHRRNRIELILTTLRFTKEIGGRNISITSGRCLPGMPPDRAAAQFVESMLPILDQADRLGVDVGIECEPGLFIEYVSELRQWIDQLQHPRLGANLDIGHCQVIGESIPAAISSLHDRIWNMHVEDIPGRKHYHMIPGEGTIDWPAFRDAVRAIDYDRFLTVELYTHTADPHAAAGASQRFLGQLFR